MSLVWYKRKLMLIDFFIRPVPPSVTPRKVILIPLTEEDSAPPVRAKKPRLKVGRPKRVSDEEQKEKRKKRRKDWLDRPEVRVHQLKMARIRAARHYTKVTNAKKLTKVAG